MTIISRNSLNETLPFLSLSIRSNIFLTNMESGLRSSRPANSSMVSSQLITALLSSSDRASSNPSSILKAWLRKRRRGMCWSWLQCLNLSFHTVIRSILHELLILNKRLLTCLKTILKNLSVVSFLFCLVMASFSSSFCESIADLWVRPVAVQNSLIASTKAFFSRGPSNFNTWRDRT